MNFDIFHKTEKIKSRTRGILEQAKELLPTKKKITDDPNYGFRFFRHPVFVIFNCLNILFLATPLFLLFYFVGFRFLETENVFFLMGMLIFSVVALWIRFYIFHRINSYLIVPGEGLWIFISEGIFSLNREQIPFDKIGISDLQKAGFWPHVFNFGDILLSSIITAKEGTVPKIVLRQVLNPERILRKLKMVVEAQGVKPNVEGFSDGS